MREIIEFIFKLIGGAMCIGLIVVFEEFVRYIVHAILVWDGKLDDADEYETWEE